MIYTKFDKLPLFRYGCIVADPPWLFQNYSDKRSGKGAAAQYDCQDIDWIKGLRVADLCKPDAVLVLWATFPMLQQALDVMTAWGFAYKSGGAWAKMSKTGVKPAFGGGYWFRSASEPFLLGALGRPSPQSRATRNLILPEAEALIQASVRGHSVKPDSQYELAEAIAEGPYLELFSRRTRNGWDSFGDQVAEEAI